MDGFAQTRCGRDFSLVCPLNLKKVFTPGQILAMTFDGSKLMVNVQGLELAALDGGGGGGGGGQGFTGTHQGLHGMLNSQTDIAWTKAAGSLVNLEGQTGPGGQNVIFRADFDFAKLGIGGLGKEFNQIFRRAFASRIFNSAVVREMGINHVRGMLLFGPPGCGKTLIARQIGKVLNAREPKIVNGPEVLDKYVGGSEEKIRALFADAEKEQASALFFSLPCFACLVWGRSADGDRRGQGVPLGFSPGIAFTLLFSYSRVDVFSYAMSPRHATSHLLVVGSVKRWRTSPRPSLSRPCRRLISNSTVLFFWLLLSASRRRRARAACSTSSSSTRSTRSARREAALGTEPASPTRW